jgi:hypothetical protein
MNGARESLISVENVCCAVKTIALVARLKKFVALSPEEIAEITIALRHRSHLTVIRQTEDSIKTLRIVPRDELGRICLLYHDGQLDERLTNQIAGLLDNHFKATRTTWDAD